MVLKIHQFRAWVVPSTAFSFHIRLNQMSLRYPIQRMDQQPRITLQFIQHIFPTEQQILSRGTVNLRSIKHLGRIQVSPLDRQRRRGPSPCQLHRLLDVQIS